MTAAELKLILQGQLGVKVVGNPDIKEAYGDAAYGMLTTLGVTEALHLAAKDGFTVDWKVKGGEVLTAKMTLSTFKNRDKTYMQVGAKVHGLAAVSKEILRLGSTVQ